RHSRDIHSFPTRRSSDLIDAVEIEIGVEVSVQSDRGFLDHEGMHQHFFKIVENVLLGHVHLTLPDWPLQNHAGWRPSGKFLWSRSEEHTSELQSRENLVC